MGMQVRIESLAQPLAPLDVAGMGFEAWASDLAAHGHTEASEVLAIVLQKAGGWSNGRRLPEEDAVLLLQVDVCSPPISCLRLALMSLV
jgi:hypothetical protein